MKCILDERCCHAHGLGWKLKYASSNYQPNTLMQAMCQQFSAQSQEMQESLNQSFLGSKSYIPTTTINAIPLGSNASLIRSVPTRR